MDDDFGTRTLKNICQESRRYFHAKHTGEKKVPCSVMIILACVRTVVIYM